MSGVDEVDHIHTLRAGAADVQEPLEVFRAAATNSMGAARSSTRLIEPIPPAGTQPKPAEPIALL